MIPFRDIFVTGTIIGLLPICVLKPWVGILAWSWLGYMNPHKLTWGFAYNMPFAQMIGIATILGILSCRDPEKRPIPWSRETILLVLLWSIFTVTTVTAMYPDEAWKKWEELSKILLFVFFTLKFFQTQYRLRIMFLVVALSLGYYGLKGGIWAVFVTFGTQQVQGPEGTFIGGNTELGLALNMILPFLLCLSREETNKKMRRFLQVVFVFSIIGVIFTYSRGAFLGLLVVLIMLFLRAKRRVVGICSLVLLSWFIWVFAPPEWFGRVETIQTYEQDNSANMRLNSWKVAWRLALDHPLTGGGFWVLPHMAIYNRYSPGSEVANSAHSIYFGILGDHGFPGLVVFVALNLSTLWSLSRLRRKVEHTPSGKSIASYCEMIQASIVAYLVSGAFLTQAYFDLYYHIISFGILLQVIAVREGLLVPKPLPISGLNVNRNRLAIGTVR
jgi:putative inorganic carbon (hco3(-)) transporter